MAQDGTIAHFISGGIAGTAGAVITCPLEVVKTRLQSSVATFNNAPPTNEVIKQSYQYQAKVHYSTCPTTPVYTQAVMAKPRQTANFIYCVKHIKKHEGIRGLFKGLGPNLIGVAPSRAIYFFTYANAKKFLNARMTPETPFVHILSAMSAGITASTCTNPIWFVKTRLQLDQKRNGSMTTSQCVKEIYSKHGIRGFYKGITASYVGVSETVIHFVIYEAIKAKLREMKGNELYGNPESQGFIDLFQYMGAGATSKTVATIVAYPHEVVRTRLRQEGSKYKSFLQTLILVAKEEGRRGLYRGLVTQFVRQIPNTAIMMGTYEVVLYLCYKYW